MMRKLVLGLFVLAVCVMMVAPMGMAGKPQPPPVYVEPTGKLVMTSNTQLLTVDTCPRVYDWVGGKFSHTWSGISARGKGVIGDVDNDGQKEVVAFNYVTTGKGNNQVTTRYIKIWNHGDSSDSPSINMTVLNAGFYMEIGDPDGDGKNELVILSSKAVEVWSCTVGYPCNREAIIYDVGGGGLTVADADNDGVDEILMGMGAITATGDKLGHGIVVKYINGVYSTVGDLGPKGVREQIDELSVGDLDGIAGNEIFGSGYGGGNIYVWRYTNGEYKQVWTVQRADAYDQNNEIADFNGDGRNEFAFSEYSTGYLVLYKYTENNVWSLMGEYSGVHGGDQDAMVAGDPDGDGAYEIVIQDQVWNWDGSAMKLVQNLGVGSNTDVSMG